MVSGNLLVLCERYVISTDGETRWLVCTSRNWKVQLKSDILSKGADRFTYFFIRRLGDQQLLAGISLLINV